MSWSDLKSLASEREPACHGYRNCCGCARCADRALRYSVLDGEGAQNAAPEAKRLSEAYFAAPWKYWDPDDGTPPVLLKELT